MLRRLRGGANSKAIQVPLLYLGYMVGSGEVRPEAKKIETVAEFPRPTTKKEVQAPS